MDFGEAARLGWVTTIARSVPLLLSATGIAGPPGSSGLPLPAPTPVRPPVGGIVPAIAHTASIAMSPSHEGGTPLSSEEWALVRALDTSSVASAIIPERRFQGQSAPPPWARTGARSAKEALQSLRSPYGLGRVGRDAVFTVDGVPVEPVQARERWLKIAPELLDAPRIASRVAAGEHPRAVRGRVSLATRRSRARREGSVGLIGRSDDRSLSAFGVLRGQHRSVGFSAGVTADRFERSQTNTSTAGRTRLGLGARLEVGRPGRSRHATAALLLLHDREKEVRDPITERRRSNATRTGLLASLTAGFGTAANGASLTVGYERQHLTSKPPIAIDETDALSLRLRGGFTPAPVLRVWAQGLVGRAEARLTSRRPDAQPRGASTWTRYAGTAAAVLAWGPLEAQLALVLSRQQTEEQSSVGHTDWLPQGELRLRLAPSWTVWAQGARSLRVPGPFELAAFLDPENAAPERGFVVSLGSAVERTHFTLALELFSASLDDAILSMEEPRTLGQADLQALGAEVRVVVRPTDDLSIRAIAAWNEGVTGDERANAGFLPTVRGFASVRWELPTRAYVELYARGRTTPWALRSMATPRFFSSTEANVRLGARGGLDLGAGFSFWASLTNALDHRARDATPSWTDTGVDLRLGLVFGTR